MKSKLTKLVKVYFDKENEIWNETILCSFWEDEQEKLLELVKDFYKNIGVVERIEVENTEIRFHIDLTETYLD